MLIYTQATTPHPSYSKNPTDFIFDYILQPNMRTVNTRSILDAIHESKNVVWMSDDRKTDMTSLALAYIVWYVAFNDGKNVYIRTKSYKTKHIEKAIRDIVKDVSSAYLKGFGIKWSIFGKILFNNISSITIISADSSLYGLRDVDFMYVDCIEDDIAQDIFALYKRLAENQHTKLLVTRVKV